VEERWPASSTHSSSSTHPCTASCRNPENHSRIGEARGRRVPPPGVGLRRRNPEEFMCRPRAAYGAGCVVRRWQNQAVDRPRADCWESSSRP
jgi:hypothetical protein